MIESILWIVLSLSLLYFGAEWLVRGGSDLAGRLGLTPLIIGLTVVACGTSMPELVVTAKAAFDGQGDIAVGNVVGSNLFNVCIILGVSALVHPLRVKMQLIRIDTPIMIGVSLVLLGVIWDYRVGRWEAGGLLVGFLAYTVMNLRLARKESSVAVVREFREALPKPTGSLGRDFAFIALGLGVLVLGSRLLVSNSVSLAKLLNVSEAVIGLTIVAAGTSMPEFATSVVAALKKQPDIALGNVIGSNIYNILAILGASALISPLHAPGIKMVDVYVLLGTSVVLLPLICSRFVVTRWEGAVLAAVYGGYLYYLWPK